jgi:hypothetical protein
MIVDSSAFVPIERHRDDPNATVATKGRTEMRIEARTATSIESSDTPISAGNVP